MATKKAAPKKVAAKRKPAASKATHTATLSVAGQQYNGRGMNVREAIAGIVLSRPPKFRGILTVSNGEREKDRILNSFVLQRLFALSPMMREIQLKQVSSLFDL
jgi:hypothetical protein